MATEFHAPHGQHFECRDCASRCCVMPWKVVVTEEEKQRFESEAWIRERLASHGVAIESVGDGLYRLPALVRNRRLECVFLDEDGLCSQVKRHDREFWSRTCKTFPFDFFEVAEGQVHVSLSQHCPAIRDNYGKPLGPQLEQYFSTFGGKATRIAETMQLGGMTQLNRPQYLRVAQLWREQIAAADSLPQGLLNSYDLTQSLAVALLDKTNPTDEEFHAAIDTVTREFTPESIPRQKKSSLLARLLLSLHLSRRSYPIWSYLSKPDSSKIRSAYYAYRNTLRLLRGKGEIDLILLPRAFELSLSDGVDSAMENPALADRAKHFFDDVLTRGNLFLRSRAMNQALLDLFLSLAILLRIARYRAAASGRRVPDMSDLGEGLSYAECIALYHVARHPAPPVAELIMSILADNRQGLIGLALVEA